MTNILQNKNISRIVFFLFLFSIPLGTKKFIYSFTGGTSEFDAVFVFLSDILFLLSFFFIYTAFFGNFKNMFQEFSSFCKEKKKIFVFLSIFSFFSLLSLLFSSHIFISAYFFLRLLYTIFQGIFLFFLIKKNIFSITPVVYVFVSAAVFQAFVGFFQFFLQKSVGVWFLGESIINEFSTNVARFPVFGVPLLRAYGTMAHANILAGFLVVGLISCLFLWINRKQTTISSFKDFLKKRLFFRTIISISLFIILVGIVLTFSRSGWIVSLFGIVISLCVGFLYEHTRKQTLHLFFIVCALFMLLFLSLGWAIFPRATLSRNEPSVNYRVLYNNIGRDIVLQEPRGVGVGNQIFFSKENNLYGKYKIHNSIDWQPIHNLYLLIASELGICGLLSFLSIGFVALPISLGRRFFIFLRSPPEYFWFGVILFSNLLVFGLFDHFLWTLESGRLMLWLVLGIMMGVSEGSSS
ncbi:MAG: O-antigen ligase family protein [Patescibacteria group bacterium]